jgi:hypothetical protein
VREACLLASTTRKCNTVEAQPVRSTDPVRIPSATSLLIDFTSPLRTVEVWPLAEASQIRLEEVIADAHEEQREGGSYARQVGGLRA